MEHWKLGEGCSISWNVQAVMLQAQEWTFRDVSSGTSSQELRGQRVFRVLAGTSRQKHQQDSRFEWEMFSFWRNVSGIRREPTWQESSLSEEHSITSIIKTLSGTFFCLEADWEARGHSLSQVVRLRILDSDRVYHRVRVLRQLPWEKPDRESETQMCPWESRTLVRNVPCDEASEECIYRTRSSSWVDSGLTGQDCEVSRQKVCWNIARIHFW